MKEDAENEERVMLESMAKEAQQVHATINSKGWTDIIRPALQRREAALIRDFADADNYETMIRVQQAMNAIRALVDYIEIKLIEGKEALSELRKDL